jgi:hypothetical protein
MYSRLRNRPLRQASDATLVAKISVADNAPEFFVRCAGPAQQAYPEGIGFLNKCDEFVCDEFVCDEFVCDELVVLRKAHYRDRSFGNQGFGGWG